MSVSNSKKQPLVSVIMNCLNCSKYLSTAIDSVYGQTYNNWEIILLDNNSDDNSLAIVKKYDDKIKYFRTSKIEKLGKARNIALEKSDVFNKKYNPLANTLYIQKNSKYELIIENIARQQLQSEFNKVQKYRPKINSLGIGLSV